LVGLIQNAIISLVPLANTPILKTSSPNKLFESLAAGIPVIITTEGWMKELVEEENLGYYVDPDRSESLTEFLTQFAEPNEEDKLRIREFATKNFDKRILAYQYLKEINEIL
jgi:glycosyltransferase involved in cell wall biosynthesis